MLLFIGVIFKKPKIKHEAESKHQRESFLRVSPENALDAKLGTNMMNKCILLYTDDSIFGGVAHYNHSLLCGLATEFSYQLKYAQTYNNRPLAIQEKNLGIEHIWLDFDTCKSFKRTLTNLDDARQVLAIAKPDLVIFSNACPFSNLAAKSVVIDLNIPFIIIEHFTPAYLLENFAIWLDELERHYHYATTVIAVSHENLALLHKFFRLPKHQGKVIYNGRPPEYFEPISLSIRNHYRQKIGIPEDAVICFTAARVELVKGYEYQFQAIQLLKNYYLWSKIYFVWSGTGHFDSQLEKLINQLGLKNKIKFLGHCWDVKSWLDASDIFILPSKSEGMPLAIMEAMAKGLPVIASAVNGIPEELGDTGQLLTDPNINSTATVNELVTTIQAWVENPKLRYLIGQNCQKRAEAMFTQARMVKQMVETIEEALLPLGNLANYWQNYEVNTRNTKTLTEFINRLHNCVNLYRIDPSKQSIVLELRQLRQELANFWLKVPDHHLETIYQDHLIKVYQSLMNCGFRSEPLTEMEQTLLQELANQLRKGFEQPQALNYLLAIMLYLPSGKMRVANPSTNLPQWLLKDYQQFFETG